MHFTCTSLALYFRFTGTFLRTTNGGTVLFYGTACDEYSMHMNPANAGKPHTTVVKYDSPPVKGLLSLHLHFTFAFIAGTEGIY